MAGEEERLTSFISTRKRAYRTPHICVSVLSFPRITGFGMCVGRRPHGGSCVFPGTANRPASFCEANAQKGKIKGPNVAASLQRFVPSFIQALLAGVPAALF